MGSVSITAYAVPPDRKFLTLGGQVLIGLPRGQSFYLNARGQVGQSDYSSWNVGPWSGFLFRPESCAAGKIASSLR
jgi:hypothetical protein